MSSFCKAARSIGLATIAVTVFVTATSGNPLGDDKTASPTGAASSRNDPCPKNDTSCAVFVFAAEKVHQKIQASLINGVPVTMRVRDWPTVIVAELYGMRDGKPDVERCTGSLIGPGNFLLAAHCLDQHSGAPRTTYLQAANQAVALECQIDPDYLSGVPDPTSISDWSKPRRKEDFALCHIDPQKLSFAFANILYETIDTTVIRPGSPILMMGYGCTDLDAKDRGDILRLGDAKAPSAVNALPGGDFMQIISHGAPEPALCQGDSGGPLLTGATMKDQTLPRRIRGVNSSVETLGPNLVSRVAVLSDASFSSWAGIWLRPYTSSYICGLGTIHAGNKCRF